MSGSNFKGFLVGLAVSIVLLVSALGGAIADRLFVFKPLDLLLQRSTLTNESNPAQKIVSEESVVIDVAEKVSPSVVTVTIQTPQRRILQFSPFGGFQFQNQGGQAQDIGSGFIVSSDGLIVTNKHVVSETNGSYKVVTKDNKEFPVKEINRDPNNDIAVLKIDASGLTPVNLGSSDNLKVGQFVVAIGTALGEFRHTVTTGVISGLGRGITAGSSFEGFVEQLDNVIQTDAAINPGNSGGPLLDSTGRVIGINVAIAQGAQNVGFAIPINVVKDALGQFNANGKFPAKAYLGVEYQMVPKQSAILNNVPEGAYIVNVIAGSPAEKAGLKVDDIITKFDEVALSDDNALTKEIAKHKSGDQIKLDVYRDGQNTSVTASLSDAPSQ
jgi:serine protease Do